MLIINELENLHKIIADISKRNDIHPDDTGTYSMRSQWDRSRRIRWLEHCQGCLFLERRLWTNLMLSVLWSRWDRSCLLHLLWLAFMFPSRYLRWSNPAVSGYGSQLDLVFHGHVCWSALSPLYHWGKGSDWIFFTKSLTRIYIFRIFAS